jgi:hypothetical protein
LRGKRGVETAHFSALKKVPRLEDLFLRGHGDFLLSRL